MYLRESGGVIFPCSATEAVHVIYDLLREFT